MLNLVMVTFNDWPLIQTAVESVYDYVDRLIFVDGVFKEFPHEPDQAGYSEDGTIEYLRTLKKETHIKIAPGLTEVDKRSLYLVGDPGDWYLHLDADEVVETPETLNELEDLDLDAAFCLIQWENCHGWYPRLFRHQEGLHYDGLHHRLVDAGGDLVVSIYGTGPGYKTAKVGLKIWHDREKRSPERKREKARYYERLTRSEKRIKEMMEYGLYPA